MTRNATHIPHSANYGHVGAVQNCHSATGSLDHSTARRGCTHSKHEKAWRTGELADNENSVRSAEKTDETTGNDDRQNVTQVRARDHKRALAR